jgi:hypothetical protein
MSALVIVPLAPPFQRFALGAILCGRMVRYLLLQHLMHLFVPIVVDPLIAADELHFDSKSVPPKTEFRQPMWARATERQTVIGADNFRQAVPAEEFSEDTAHVALARTGRRYAEDISRVQIAHRQWLDSPTVQRAKPAFQVSGPHVIARTRDPAVHRHRTATTWRRLPT